MITPSSNVKSGRDLIIPSQTQTDNLRFCDGRYFSVADLASEGLVGLTIAERPMIEFRS
jgi:hypothetical protein